MIYQECHNGALSSGLGAIIPQANLCGKDERTERESKKRDLHLGSNKKLNNCADGGGIANHILPVFQSHLALSQRENQGKLPLKKIAL